MRGYAQFNKCTYILINISTSIHVLLLVFFPFILDIKFVRLTSRGHTGGRSHRIFHPPSFIHTYMFCCWCCFLPIHSGYIEFVERTSRGHTGGRSHRIFHPPSFIHTYMFSCWCCFLPFWTSSSLDVPAGVAQEEGHTGFFIHLPSAVRFSYSFPSSTVKLNFAYQRFNRSPLVRHFFFFFFFFMRKIPFTGIELTSQRVRRLQGYL